jgi:hypothetical protein
MQHIPVNELVMRHLRTPEEIQAVLPLRGHIDLTAHHGVDPLFDVREKKETK